MIRKFGYLMLLCLTVLNLPAQNNVRLIVTELENEAHTTLFSKNISSFLTALNVAGYNNEKPILDNVVITEEAQQVVQKLWKDCPFVCFDEQIVQRAIQTPTNEYQVRSIHLLMKPNREQNEKIDWKKYQEGVVTIDSSGRITNFHLAVDAELYVKVLNSARRVSDLQRRMLIMDYVEQFRNAYNLKDINFLQQVYSDDALIITGRVVKVAKSDFGVATLQEEKIEYSKQDKKTYLAKLERVFDKNERIDVVFDEIDVKIHPVQTDFYGVTLKQYWSSDTYSDEGWLFLLWDFSNPEAPQVHVRTWQPSEFQGKPLPREEVFSLADFDC